MEKKVLGLLAGLMLVQPLSALAQDAAADAGSDPSLAPETPNGELPTSAADAPLADAAPEATAAAPAAEPATVPVDTAASDDTTAPAADETGRSGSRLVEEIVVTAQKREENIQDVPISITAYSPEKLDALGVKSVQDLERVTPGLTISNAAGYNLVYLRGIGTDAFLPGADPSVPFYVDGVALLGTQGSSDTLGRIERVEVLKGPQGTLFGRNATGGAISIVTPDPNGSFSGDVKVEIGQDNVRNAVVFVNLPILDNVYATVSAFNNQRENPFTNTAGPELPYYGRGMRAKLRWDATDDLALTLSASNLRASNNAGIAFENTRPAPRIPLGPGVPLIPTDPKADRKNALDAVSGAQTSSQIYSGIVDWALPWVDVKLIAAEQNLRPSFVQADFDGSAIPVASFTSISQPSEQTSVELQVLSNADTPFADRLQWVAGFYYLDSFGGFDPLALNLAPHLIEQLGLPNGAQLADALSDLLIAAGIQPIPNQGVRIYTGGVLDSEAYSGYLQGTYKVTDTIDLTLGVRYQEETRQLLRSRLAVPDAEGNEIVIREDNVPDLKAEQISPKVSLQWRPGEFGQIYTSWGRAFKSPTYNTVNLFSAPEKVEEERVDSYEIGIKSDLFDNSLRLNAAAFYIEQKDLLTGFVALTSGGVVNYDNAGSAEIKGVEFDFVWSPMPESNPGLAIAGGATVIDSEYTDYRNGRGYDEDTGLAFGEGLLPLLPARDFTGNKITRTPDLTYALAVSQSFNVPGGSIELGADMFYNDGFFFTAQNSDLYARESYTLVNARISYFYDAWNLQFTIYGDNVTNEEYNETVFVADFGRNQLLNDPGIYGVRLQWSF